MNKTHLEQLKASLTEERKAVALRLQGLVTRDLNDDEREALDREEVAEQVNETATREVLADSEDHLLTNIDSALSRIADGTYGECIDCCEAIPIKRLQANPSAPLCVKCQDALESEPRS